MTLDLNYFKNLLEKEKKEIEAGLSAIGARDPKNPDNWEPVMDKSDSDENIAEQEPDKEDAADNMENFVERYSMVNDVLEVRLKNINNALAAIERNTYGICGKGDKGTHQIPKERLTANPAVTTCVEHAESK